MIVLGIDPGLATVGIGLIEKSQIFPQGPSANSKSQDVRLVDFCTIETSAGLPAAERLREIAADLGKILEEHRPALAVVEKLYFETNRKTAMQVAEARGVILLTVQQHGVPVLEPTPLELKLAVTGDGRADKRQVCDMLRHHLGLAQEVREQMRDDVTDALALAVYGALTHASVTVR